MTRLPRKLLVTVPMLAAWIMFFASFFLPATNVVEKGGTPPGTPLLGWDAFCRSLLLLPALPLVLIAEPRALLFLTFPFINAAMLVIPLVALRDPELAPLCGATLAPPGIVPWLLPKMLTGDLFIGFYLWNLSFFAMAVGCILFGLADRSSLREARYQYEGVPEHAPRLNKQVHPDL
jgi:hypothetical protein